ncbi:hypothetical protein DI09_27p160 [Mitosporidium daphniae]|uniref:RuvB-like helicase n=1 Tax=Mitosporidium daphniae TaxID=1485682 RepID=A0A098VS01_9MICR|nr:uncharacterized protein DI09_27p160 [Mitosporidium daphniae]KGG51777.1 hypothetical protein DI09_27p160 [Mitosporidium daphniae]|eukprot:XP_013238204.1 uncharacterized protein DI09_27p160 [Mitosporidium daphniae]
MATTLSSLSPPAALPVLPTQPALCDLTRVERIGAHSHIRGLGIDERTLEALPASASEGMVGQASARKAAGMILRLIKEGRTAGRAVLITGEPGTGKTALALGLAQSLGPERATPFTPLSASELLFSLEISKTEALTQAFRRSIGIQIKELNQIVEGEVVEVIIDEPIGGAAPTGRVTLKTTDMEAVFDLGAKMVASMMGGSGSRITAGDIVSIDKANGRLTRLGRSYARARDFDACGNPAATKWLPTPEGELIQERLVTHLVTLHDIDVVNSRAGGYLALFSGETGEIKPETRAAIDERVAVWRDEAKAEIIPGVLFIDEIHLLDAECFSFLNRALESSMAPVLVMATNRGITAIRGSEGRSSLHGMPSDLLDRLLIITTNSYSKDELSHILQLRAQEEDVRLGSDALNALAEIAVKSSLRYATQLIALSQAIARGALERAPHSSKKAQQHEDPAVTTQHIETAFSLFLDEKRSVEYCKDIPMVL